MEAEEVGHEHCEIGHACQADAEIQAGAAVVIPRVAPGQRVAVHDLRLERGDAVVVVRDALYLSNRLRHQPPTPTSNRSMASLNGSWSATHCPTARKHLGVQERGGIEASGPAGRLVFLMMHQKLTR